MTSNSPFEERLGDRVVEPRRGGDDDCVDPIRAHRFPLDHLAPVDIDAIGREQLLPAGCDGDLGVDRHRAGDQVVQSVGAHGDQMSAADDRVAAAAHHADADAAAERLNQ